MKKYLLLVLSLFLFFVGCNNNEIENEKNEQIKSELSSHAENFMKGLKNVLLANMKEGGALQAVTVCSDTAQSMTKNYAISNNLEIKRVSYKNRNPSNIPDEFESKAIEKFEQLLKDNALNKETSLI